MTTITLTFGDCAENHKGMQILGTKSEITYSYNDLEIMAADFGLEFVDLSYENHKACVVIARNYVKPRDELLQEMLELDWDKKYFDTRRNRVLNKLARWNLCFDDKSQEPNYEDKEGRIIAYEDVPILSELRKKIIETFNVPNLVVEGNYYYDKNCGIGYHGDGERNMVIGVRLGDTMPFRLTQSLSTAPWSR
jgi:hypothetical protein